MKNCNCIEKTPKKFFIKYYGKIRNGSYPKKTKNKFKVITCSICEVTRLYPFPKISYETKVYRKLYNDDFDIKSFKKYNNVHQTPGFFGIKKNEIKNKNVLDYGCGYGLFLDNISKDVKKTFAIEPQKDLKDYLSKKGHQVIDYEKPKNSNLNTIDVITSFGVIEHTKNPIKYLKIAKKLLKKNGCLYLCTDNLNDILMKSNIKEFNEFYYRTAHYWYFTAQSLKKLLIIAGFRKIKIRYLHNHGMENFLHWMKNKKPLNDNNLKRTKLNKLWIKTLNKSGNSELLFASCKK